MQLNDYQEQIAKFAIYPDANTSSPTELTYLGLGLGGESGEVLEKLKKYIRDGVLVRPDVAKELGDVLWYLTRMSNALGYSLQEVAQMNVDKLTSRQERNVLSGNGDDR
jgi:NTP pyrophosphatase (non-canonical NTP hydrolase)